jgi:hypothetical protein
MFGRPYGNIVLVVDVLRSGHFERTTAAIIFSVHDLTLREQSPQVFECNRVATQQVCDLLHGIRKSLQ